MNFITSFRANISALLLLSMSILKRIRSQVTDRLRKIFNAGEFANSKYKDTTPTHLELQ